MPRTLTPGFEAAMAAGTLRPALFGEFEFSGGTVRFWSGGGQIQWDGKTWTGAGIMGGISAVTETADVQANPVRFSLSGIATELIGASLGEVRTGAPVRLWLGLLDTSTWAVIADPVSLGTWRMDVPIIDETGETATISLTCESRLIELEKSAERRYTDEDQRQEYPDDRGFEYVAALQDKEVVWG